jgi:hypothetical protein
MKLSKLSLAIITAAGLLSIAPAIHAQTNSSGSATTASPRRRGGMNPETRLKALETALGSTNKLSGVQKPKVKALLDEQVKKTQELTSQRDTLSQDELRTKRRALTEEINTKMKEILDADQYKVWQQQARRGRGGRRQAGGGGQTN